MDFNKRKLTDADLIKLSTQFRYGVIGRTKSWGKCLLVTSPLYCYLKFLKVDCKMIEGYVTIGDNITNHYWILLPDNRILDATADQFNEVREKQMPKVFVGEKPDWYMEKKKKR